MGNGSLVDEAMVDQWCDFANQKLELLACVWWYQEAGYGCLKPETIHVLVFGGIPKLYMDALSQRLFMCSIN